MTRGNLSEGLPCERMAEISGGIVVFVGFCDEIWRFLQLSKIILVSFAVFNARKTQHIVVGKFLEDFRYFS